MPRQNFVGIVVSQGKMAKTVKVRVQQPTFNKAINKQLFNRKDYLVHDEGNVCREGDLVRIEATRPLSARKSFAIAQILKNKGQQFARYEQDAKINVAREENQKASEFLARRRQYRLDLQNDTGLINELLFIDKIAGTPEGKASAEDVAKAEELKKKHNINSWPPEKEIFKLDVQTLRNQITDIQNQINQEEQINVKVQSILGDEELTNSVLEKLGKDPTQTKSHIRKNLIRKYVVREAQL